MSKIRLDSKSSITAKTSNYVAVAASVRNLIHKSLHDVLDESDITNIEKQFICSNKNKLNSQDLRKMLAQVAKIEYEDEEFETLYQKINIYRDDYICWDEFISHLILGFQSQDETSNATSLELPIVGLPKVVKSFHRQPVTKITFCPAILADGTISWLHGNYLSLSKDGIINYWNVDFINERSVQSTSPKLKIRPTWVTDMVAMPDVNVVCTSSTERELRFYDTTAKKFELRVMLSSLEYAPCAMCYHYKVNLEHPEESKLIFGDQGGHIRIIFIYPYRRGPFKSEPGTLLRHVRYERFLRGGAIPFMRVLEIKNIHTDWVRQVAYYPSLSCFVSVANCPKQAMFLSDFSRKSVYSFKVVKGITCMDLDDTAHIIVTGGPDCMIRVWNPFVPKRPNSIFSGHHTAIVSLILQDNGKRLFSLSTDKCIKIWDVGAQTCTQTYSFLPPNLGEHSIPATYYNPYSQQVFVASMRIAIIVVCGKLNADETDGYTHISPISTVLYNPLFKVLCTCGQDSAFIIWNPYTGKRLMVVKDAHTRLTRGELLPVEITTATFDPEYQLLLTGARDGTLKVWNFNTGTCIRNMSIEVNCEVSSVIWLKYRILAIGWNKHVTEFPDGGPGLSASNIRKDWDTRHTEDVFCATARVPQALATSSYNGELVFWRLETGQPYRRYQVANPTGRIAIRFKSDAKASSKSSVRSRSSSRSSVSSSASQFSTDKRLSTAPGREQRLALPNEPVTIQALSARARRISVVQIPKNMSQLRNLSVHAMCFLNTRPMLPKVGALLVAVENGTIQIWSHHPAGGFVTSFSAIHTTGDYIMAMATDNQNQYLFTGHTAGYVKTWLMVNFGLPEKKSVFLPMYRLVFPFLWTDVIQCRAKRAVRGQELPILLNSYRAHCFPVTGLVFIDETAILCSCSSDHSARLWTLGGRYLGTLGTFKEWQILPADHTSLRDNNFEFRIPPDIKRIASYTTLKVLNGGCAPRTVRRKPPEEKRELTAEELEKGVYGKPLSEPFLGNHFKFPNRCTNIYNLKLDSTLPYIPIYSHLNSYETKDPPRISTPPAIAEHRSAKGYNISMLSSISKKK